MDIRLKPATEQRIRELASMSHRSVDDIIEDAVAGYLEHVAELRDMIESRYDDFKSGRVKPIDGETFFEALRQRGEELLKKRQS
ncbi:MAG: hypothetical protein LAO19_09775 [Acidobacteriia bacterium]|nr:hypothetical protein [Terriglobia bacterium]